MPVRQLRSSLKQTIIRKDKAVRAELRGAALDAGHAVADKLDKAVRSWSAPNRPRFAVTAIVRPDRIEARVNIAGSGKQIFQYIDQGTGRYGKSKRPYLIPKVPQPGKLLKFRTGYSAKTAPIARANVGSGRATGDWVSKAQVLHPGIKARHFLRTYTKQAKPSFDQRINAAIKRGATS